MTKPDHAAWSSLAMESWSLSYEAASVMWMRSLRIMAGGKLAEREAERMMREKFVANLMLWPALMLGGVAQSPAQLSARALRHYSGPVRANHRRLSR
ncbi:hypothetical protein GRI62_10290 [Erythrobacter arachoides]|uniref:Uncharacterized protein n=1 Tax=Aurantiacibacter arachoides TaxID=1850444 RepID=A0A845A8U7_9SPHN|nr:hypothetical protein [Aurantiacibacter arachoides]MXO93989.1 hypothetical protein [Aurantiacibacter arachoides]GGD44994.1 hypothetical protein GCM10011411_00780 [Aurantiacibacter arachoides]